MTPAIDRIVRHGAAAIGSWPAFGLLMLLCVLIFGYIVPKAKAPIFAHAATTLRHKVLDEYFPSWSPQIADDFLAAIGPAGRAAYRRFYWIMDFWFPGTIASLATASLLLIAFPPPSHWAWLCVLAAPAWLFDAAENITHFRMAGSYPKLPAAAVHFGPSFTRLKWLFAIIPLPVALAGFAFRLLRGG